MGQQGDIDGMYIVRNATFLDTNFWSPFPPWVLEGNRAKWPLWTISGDDDLFQVVPVLFSETYKVTLDIEIVGNSRHALFGFGDILETWFLAAGTHHKEFEATPTIGDQVRLGFNQAVANPSVGYFDNIWVWGKPGGSTMFGNFSDSALSSRQGFRFEQTSAIGGDNTYRACNRSDGTRINVRYTP